MQQSKGRKYQILQHLEIENRGRVEATNVIAKSILSTNSGVYSSQIKTVPLCKKVHDNQGNIFGLFKLGKLKSKERRVLQLVVTIEPLIYKIDSLNLGKISEIDSKLRQTYCRSSKYWKTDYFAFKDITEVLIEETEVIEVILQRIFTYLNSLIFRENLLERRGAVKAYQTKYGDCDEFTDLFVTLTRKIGIPSRRVTGIFFNSKRPEHHAWAEAYSPRVGWIPFDPALGYFASTSINHIPRKLEATVSNIPDYEVRFKSKRATEVAIHTVEDIPLVQILT